MRLDKELEWARERLCVGGLYKGTGRFETVDCGVEGLDGREDGDGCSFSRSGVIFDPIVRGSASSIGVLAAVEPSKLWIVRLDDVF